jgi:hypothetical protein
MKEKDRPTRSSRLTLELVGFGLRKAIENSTLFKISEALLTPAAGVGRLAQFLGSRPSTHFGGNSAKVRSM